jgi:hypothetical protein
VFVSKIKLTPYSPNSEIFLKQQNLNPEEFSLLSKFFRWDSLYFISNASEGYDYENRFAFFPFYPMMTNLSANFFERILPIERVKSLLISAILISNASHFLYALCIYR